MSVGQRTPAACPQCGHDGAFDSMSAFGRRTATHRLGEDGYVEKWERWERMHCPECGEQFALLEKTVRIPHDEDGNEIEGERELVPPVGHYTTETPPDGDSR